MRRGADTQRDSNGTVKEDPDATTVAYTRSANNYHNGSHLAGTRNFSSRNGCGNGYRSGRRVGARSQESFSEIALRASPPLTHRSGPPNAMKQTIGRLWWMCQLRALHPKYVRATKNQYPELLRTITEDLLKEVSASRQWELPELSALEENVVRILATMRAGDALLIKNPTGVARLVQVVNPDIVRQVNSEPHIVAGTIFGAPPGLAPFYLMGENPENHRWAAIFQRSEFAGFEETFRHLPEQVTQTLQILRVPDRTVLLKARTVLQEGGSVFLYADTDAGAVRPRQHVFALGRERPWGHGAAELHRRVGCRSSFVLRSIRANYHTSSISSVCRLCKNLTHCR